MSEIEKMYENAGIEPKYIDACTVEDKYWQNEELANEYGTFDMYMNAKCGQQEDCTTLCSCAYTKEEYPPFTAEKQLAIFKMFCRRYLEVSQHVEENGDLCFGIKATVGDYAVGFNEDFAECLADFVNCLWQDLTEEEKQQVKGILE